MLTFQGLNELIGCIIWIYFYFQIQRTYLYYIFLDASELDMKVHERRHYNVLWVGPLSIT